MAQVKQAYKAEYAEDGQSPIVNIKHKIFDAPSSQEAMAALYAQTPSTWNVYGDNTLVLPKLAISCERLNNTSWDGEVIYGIRPNLPVAPIASELVSPDPEFDFETGGATRHISQALSTKGYPDAVAPDFGNAISVTRDGIQGVDIVIPSYQWSETHYLPNSVVTAEYKNIIAEMTGTVHGHAVDAINDFRGFQPGEVLLLGVRGSKRGGGDWQLTFSFSRLMNEVNLKIGGITVEKKRGWEHLWIRTHESLIGTGENQVVAHVPSYAYVAQVYQYTNFSRLNIGMDPI